MGSIGVKSQAGRVPLILAGIAWFALLTAGSTSGACADAPGGAPTQQRPFFRMTPASRPTPPSTNAQYPRWWGQAPVIPPNVPCKDPGKCVKCHQRQSTMEPVHAFACVRCHRGNPEADDEDTAHK
ncbi:MAG: hypothetical protein V2B18_19900, partial [Pseudomonadota bacterium]